MLNFNHLLGNENSLDSWKTRDSSSIQQIVVYRAESSDGSPPLPERGVTVYPPDNNEVQSDEQVQCTITLTCKNPPYQMDIAAVDVISSAKALEVYTEKKDYISTEGGMRLNIEAGGGNKVFLAQHTFVPPLPACMIKFVSRHRKHELHLHSILISLVEATPSNPELGGINLPEVKNMLGQSGTEMSDSAKALLTTMETFQKNKSSSNAMFGGMIGSMMGATGGSSSTPNMASLAGMFASMGMGRNASNLGLTNRAAELSPNFDSVEQNTSCHSSANNSNESNANIPQNGTTNCDKSDNLFIPQLAKVFESKLLEMERRILNKITQEIALSEKRLARLITERTGGVVGETTTNETEPELD